MSGHHIQSSARDAAVDVYRDELPPQDWGGGQDAGPAPSGPKLGRYLSAINRFKWLILLFVLLGAGGGYSATKFVTPEYEVNAIIMLEMGNGTNGGDRGPIQARELLESSGWQDLLRSYSIADPVVNNLGLFVSPARAQDSSLFRSFRVVPGAIPGDYVLTVNGDQYSLFLKLRGEVEKGAIADSIGRLVGFLWAPGAQAFAGHNEVAFHIQTPREASNALISKLDMGLNPGSPILTLSLTGENSGRTAATLNAWVVQFVAKATELKKNKVMTLARILEGQREYAAEKLNAADNALLRFSVSTATEPVERQSAIAGVDRTTNPAFDAYFRDKILAENYRQDRESIMRLIQPNGNTSLLTREALLSIPLVASDPAAEDLRNILKEQSEREVRLRQLRESYTDEFQRVKDEVSALETVRTATLPRAVNAFLAQLQLREGLLTENIKVSGQDLQGIPKRTIEELRLKRQVEAAAELYKNLDLKSAEAQLAEASTIPDVRILDSAVPPLRPTRNTAPAIILGAIGAALALGVFLAILLDQVDKRFRYPEQATDDLGLFVLGVVPVVNTRKRGAADYEAQVIEAFRTIRMNVRYAADPARPLAITITSPGPNDGKSLISSNLALSFAESGARTLLIDGDIRRGELAKTFGTTSKPGLVEYLDGTALIAEVLHPAASHPNLTLMPGGARRRRAPELLATPRLSQLIHQMSAEYDVVIVDSPPLGAGFDAYALATATGNMALVMRASVTDRKMAAAKMATIDTLPVRVMGAVLNGIKLTGAYQYYSYYQDYAAEDEVPTARIASGPSAAIELHNASTRE